MSDFITEHGLDLFTTILGLLYIFLEYRASIWLWLVGALMPALDVCLYYGHGLYGDAAMAVYYTLAAIYGFIVWKWKASGKKAESGDDRGISHMPGKLYLRILPVFLLIWAACHYLLAHFTDSTVPLLDSFTNALSVIGLWALSRKYVEQWAFWIVVDAVCCYLYIVKGIPFKALLYGLYVVMAVAGWRRWNRLIAQTPCAPATDGKTTSTDLRHE